MIENKLQIALWEEINAHFLTQGIFRITKQLSTKQLYDINRFGSIEITQNALQKFNENKELNNLFLTNSIFDYSNVSIVDKLNYDDRGEFLGIIFQDNIIAFLQKLNQARIR